ncbi:alpha-galactosidase [Dichotomocladium elegans]|nr:alpha-galactosidase [Dichotomocladium elegans]
MIVAEAALDVGVHKHPSLDTWFLVTEKSTYVVGASTDGFLINLHWGKRLTRLENLNATVPPITLSQIPPISYATEEIPVFGGLRYREAALKVEFVDGIGSTMLDIKLRDSNRTGFSVTLHYDLDVENDIIRRSYTVYNGLKDCINLERAFSAAWHPPTALNVDERREVLTLAGEWAHEAQVHWTTLHPGVTHTIQSPRGFTDHVSYPYFAIRQVPSDVNPGTEVYFGALAWGGSWEIAIHTNTYGYTRITGGIHHLDFGWTLEPGESFNTPWFIAGFTDEGMPGARKRLPRHARMVQKESLATQKKDTVHNPVLYNSWEAVAFDVTAEKQMALAEKAASLGVELFVVDDGWFGARDNDSAGLGDWFVNPNKFPEGMKPLADRVHTLGMKFGLWFEPESTYWFLNFPKVNPNSNLYREHPDWVFYYDGIPRYESRNQLLLNLGLQEVQDYIYERVSTIIAEVGVDYIKWDMNRPYQGVTMHNYDRNPKEAWVLAARGYHTLLSKLKKKYPQLWIESCSSGGGRMDLSVLEYVDQVWTSDNTRPDARILIQYGASLFLPPRTMYGWVTDSGTDNTVNIPLSFRFHISYMGGLGIGSNLNRFTEEELEETAAWIKLYKQLRPVIQNGDLDWLVPPSRVGELLAVSQTTSHDQSKAVVLGFRQGSPFSDVLSPVRLRNLDQEAAYKVQVWYTSPDAPAEEYELSGSLIMSQGIKLDGLNFAFFRSAVVYLQKNWI